MGHFLNTLEDVETAAAAIPLHGIGRVGHHLEFVQNELRNYQNAVEETGIGDIGDAAVDDDAGIEDLLIGAGLGFSAEYSAQSAEIEQFALGGASDASEVNEENQADDLDKM
jgi:hypothetical protein